VCKLLKLPGDKPLVLGSFGGYGVPDLDTDALARFKKYTVISTTSLPLGRSRKEVPAVGRKGSFITVNEEAMYDAGVRYEDLVGAAEAVVTKPGYGIVSECIANDAAILYTSRGHFPEYDVLVDEMPKHARTAFIGHEDLLAGKWETQLDRLLAQPKPKKKPELNGADVAADILLKALDKPPKKPRGRPRAKP
jgi:L-arabinokinase